MNVKILVPLVAFALLAACSDRNNDTGVGGNTTQSPEPPAPTTATPGVPPENPPMETPPAETPPADTPPAESPPTESPPPPTNQ